VVFLKDVLFSKSQCFNLVSLMLINFLIFSPSSFANHDSACSPKWKVTGYFTPIEIEYPQSRQTQISVEKIGRSIHSSEFLDAVKIEGWGKTKEGWYLGRFSNKWHKSKHPLNSIGKPLRTGSIATDKRVIPTGTNLTIPTLPNHLKHQQYISDDVGSAIKNLHVDIYTGEGRQAEKMTYEITGKDHTVCRISSI
jgi:3D (Asp-Asp-Asp) domain-containing protein